MKMRSKAAVMILPLAAVLAGCTQDATEPSARPAAPSFDGIGFPYDTIYGYGGYYGSGHREPPPPPPSSPDERLRFVALPRQHRLAAFHGGGGGAD